MKSWLIAQMLDLDPFTVTYGDGQRKRLAAEYLAGHVMRGVIRFCQSADEQPTADHFPYIDGIDLPTDKGKRTYENNNRIAEHLEPTLAKAWGDLRDPAGQLPYRHDHYLKLWQLSHPITTAEYLLFDEAQDASPVMAAVIAEQHHAQRVYVGDANQAIYGFTGAVNSIAEMRETGVSYRRLTNSFRFGPAIAGEANAWLELLDTDLRLVGLGGTSTIGALDHVDQADAILCRTNAGAMTALLKAQRRGVVAHLVGGGTQVLSFARAAGELMTKGRTYHPELACFESWGEVQSYVSQDPAGGELRLLVDLIDEFGVDVIQRALGAMPSEAGAALTISTAHKAKGREWRVVQIDGDFAECDLTDEQLRLEYVSITRAREHLDHSALDPGRVDDAPALPPVSGTP